MKRLPIFKIEERFKSELNVFVQALNEKLREFLDERNIERNDLSKYYLRIPTTLFCKKILKIYVDHIVLRGEEEADVINIPYLTRENYCFDSYDFERSIVSLTTSEIVELTNFLISLINVLENEKKD